MIWDCIIPLALREINVISGHTRGGNKLLFSERQCQLMYLDVEISFLKHSSFNTVLYGKCIEVKIQQCIELKNSSSLDVCSFASPQRHEK